jgi:hypothetical protein
MANLLELLKSPANENHKLAAAMSGTFSNNDWNEAIQQIAFFISEPTNDGVKHFSPIFKTLNHIWYLQTYYLNGKMQAYLIYDSHKICLLHDNFAIKYKGDGNMAKAKRRLFAAIQNFEDSEM